MTTQDAIGTKHSTDMPRDAIHIAVVQATANDILSPGESVNENGDPVSKAEAVGIVDPFLQDYVFRGERFFIFLKPNTVTGMRHHWDHPNFSDKDEADELWGPCAC